MPLVAEKKIAGVGLDAPEIRVVILGEMKDVVLIGVSPRNVGTVPGQVAMAIRAGVVRQPDEGGVATAMFEVTMRAVRLAQTFVVRRPGVTGGAALVARVRIVHESRGPVVAGNRREGNVACGAFVFPDGVDIGHGAT